MNQETWHIPLANDGLTIREALDSMESFKLHQQDVPLIIRLLENPEYNLIPGAVTLQCHDIIHVLLGRGLLPKDEAFVIGFTMGTTRRINWLHKYIFKLVTKYLYPAGYTFGNDELVVFEKGLELGEVSKCPDLSKLDLSQFISYTIKEARDMLYIDLTHLRACYALEQITYISPESQRLLSK